MGILGRDPAAASGETYDLIVVGGGIYGACLLLEASRRGMRSLLVEQNDFGGATSFNSLRIVHGGLRYLQSFDWHRFRESVRERSWLLRNFSGLVKPMGCLMPLYGKGLHRPSLLRLALNTNDACSRSRNRGLPPSHQIPSGRIISREETLKLFPVVDTAGLKGGALWFDGFVADSPRLVIEMLRWSCGQGATALNYLEGCELLKDKQGKVAGILGFDRESHRYHEYRAGIVINAAGPWSRILARRFDRDHPALFKSSLAWNVLFERKVLSEQALAVTPKRRGARTYFLVPWHGRLFAGTGHAPWHDAQENPRPSVLQLQEFMDDLNLAVPGLNLQREEICRVFAGLLPSKEQGKETLAVREVIVDHSCCGGPQGLFSVSGVKLTTARLVAAKTIELIRFRRMAAIAGTVPVDPESSLTSCRAWSQDNGQGDLYNAPPVALKSVVRQCIEEESVQHLDDLILRRTSLWFNPGRILPHLDLLCEVFGWDETRRKQEIKQLARRVSFPSTGLAEKSR